MAITEIILVFSIGMYGEHPAQQIFEYTQENMGACQVEKKKLTDSQGTSARDGIYRYTAFCIKRIANQSNVTNK